jgi:hypothetical protein
VIGETVGGVRLGIATVDVVGIDGDVEDSKSGRCVLLPFDLDLEIAGDSREGNDDVEDTSSVDVLEDDERVDLGVDRLEGGLGLVEVVLAVSLIFLAFELLGSSVSVLALAWAWAWK